MKLRPYLEFNGDCEAAFRFYEHCLGGTLGPVFHYAGTPLAAQVPAEWQHKVMHASLTIGGQMIMGGDVAPDRYEGSKGFSLSLHLDDTAEADRIFQQLSEGGRVLMAPEKTFWAALFGVVVDRYGISWTINCGGSD